MNPIIIRKTRVNNRQTSRRFRSAYNVLKIKSKNLVKTIASQTNFEINSIGSEQSQNYTSPLPINNESLDTFPITDNSNIEQENFTNVVIEQQELDIPDSSSSNSQSQSHCIIAESINDENSLQSIFKKWVIDCRPNVSHVDKLLKALNKHSIGITLPKTYETLMSTPRNLEFRDVTPGKYFHVGVRYTIKRALKYYSPVVIKDETINIDINIDGLPIYTTSSAQFWPILGHIRNISFSNPFVIGIYLGKSKPASADDFLKDFIEEMKDIDENGLQIDNFLFKVKIRAVICDMPAKAFIKYIKGHNAYYSCSICIQSGEYLKGRMCFPECDASLRSDITFRNRIHEEHHLNDGESISPFERLSNIDMIYSFPLDYMHLLLLGVMKKLLLIWRAGDLSSRMSANAQTEMTRMLLNVRVTQSRNFSRLSRSFDDISNWRSTEFRTFLLYTGPCILKDLIQPEMYSNFLYLHIATKLCIKEEYSDVLHIAQKLYQEFVTTFENCYGVHLVSSNVHNTIHLVDFVRRFGVLDNFSAFPHEATLGKIKEIVVKHSEELQQVAKRIIENEGLMIRSTNIDEIVLSKPMSSKAFTKLNYKNQSFYNDEKDGWILSITNKIVRINYFTEENSMIFLNGDEISEPYRNIYDLPIESSKLFMYKVHNKNIKTTIQMNIEDIKFKIFFFNIPQDKEHSYFMGM